MLYRQVLMNVNSNTTNLLERWHKKGKVYLGPANRFPVVVTRLLDCCEQGLSDFDYASTRSQITFRTVKPPDFLIEMALIMTPYAVEQVEDQLSIPTTSFTSINVTTYLTKMN